MVGYWPFNGNANDESGNGNNGTVNGATLTTDRNGNANSAYSFDGINDNITIPHNQIFNFSNGFTLNFWLNINQFGPNNQWFIDKSFDPGSYHWGIGMDGEGQISTVFLTSNGSMDTNGSSNFYLSIQTWKMLTMTYDGSIVKVHHDSEIIWSIAASGDMVDNTLPIKFGNFPHSNMPPYGYHYNGLIDDIAIYNRALTQEEITSLYNGATSIPGCTNTTACNYNASATQDDGSCTFPAQTYLNCAGSCLNDANNNGICDEVEATFPSYLPANGLVAWYPFNGNANDESGHGNNGTVNGATLTADRNGNANSAYLFSGVPDRIDIGTSLNPSFSMGAPQSSWTVAAWVNKNSNNEVLAFSDYNSVLGNTNPGENDITLSSHLQVNGNMAYVSMRSNAQEFGANGGNFLSNEWRHIAFSASNNSIKLFSDGQLISEVNYDSNLNYFESPFYRIGSSMWNGNYGPSTGIIDDIAIYNRALTPTEISALYTGTNSNGGNGNNTSSATSTVPAGISYQAVARNAQGTALANTAIQVKFSLIADSLSGTTEYVETHSLSTNTLGLFATAFGTGSAVTGTWVGINWTHANKYLKVELDAGNGFVELGTQQLLSSPFAIRAQSAATLENGALPVYLDNAAAIAGGLTVGKLYRTATGDLKVVY